MISLSLASSTSATIPLDVGDSRRRLATIAHGPLFFRKRDLTRIHYPVVILTIAVILS